MDTAVAKMKIKRRPKARADRFGWGDPTAADAWIAALHPGASKKANPYHHGGGDDPGGQFTTPDDSTILFEAAPDPNNKELTQRWETLTAEEKAQVSNAVVKDIMPDAMKTLQTQGVLENRIGGYEGYTNPCYALSIDGEHATDAAKLMGYALSQDSVAITSDHAMAGLDQVGVAVVQLSRADMNPDALAAHYENLGKIVDGEGNPVIGGFTTLPAANEMHILNFSGMKDSELAAKIDKQLGGKYNVYTDKVYSTLIEKKDYLNAGDSKTQGQGASVWRQSADNLRQIASNAINGELKRRGKAAVQKLRYAIRKVIPAK